MKLQYIYFLCLAAFTLSCGSITSSDATLHQASVDSTLIYQPYQPKANDVRISRSGYQEKLYGFWLGQCIANWTGLVTEMDKIGNIGDIKTGDFYTREDWGKPDLPSIWGEGVPSDLSPTIDFVFRDTGEVWGADDDTDIEYIYQHLLHQHQTSMLNAEHIRDGWLKHIKEQEENYLWVSNQKAFDLMKLGMRPPMTSNPQSNPHYEMIDAQLTTEIFGLFAPLHPEVAKKMAHLPIRTTARKESAWIAEFYVTMYSLAAGVNPQEDMKSQILAMADEARKGLPDNSYPAKMYDFVKDRYQHQDPWEEVRDELYRRFQVNAEGGYLMINPTEGMNVWRVFKDSKNQIWAGLIRDGLVVMDMKGNVLHHFKHDSKKPESTLASDNCVWSVYEDQQQQIWLGTGEGVTLYQEESNSFKHYVSSDHDTTSVSNGDVLVFYEDSQNNFWVGLNGGGLNLMNRETGTFKRYTESDGLAGSIICGILEDDHENLWLSTNKGISKFDINTQTFINYNTSHGLQGDAYSRNSYYKDAQGYMYFGGLNGFNRFHPDSIKINTFSPPVVITDFQLFNKAVPIGIAGSPLQKDISLTKHIVLTHEQSVFNVSFSALSYTAPESNQYAYKLEGFDKEWIYTSAKRRFATYTSLPAGIYTLRVKASNNDGVWNEVGVSVVFEILPPWWQTWWFRTIVMLVIISSLIGFYRYRTAQLKAQKRKLEQQVKARTAEVVEQKNEIQAQNEEIMQQSEELQMQRDYLEVQRNATQKAYDNIKVLSDIGQKITGILDLNLLNHAIYQHVNTLMDAPAFGIGLYNEKYNRLDFHGFIENGEVLADSSDSLEDDNKLSAWCFLNQKEVLINDFKDESQQYIDESEVEVEHGALPHSIIYLPLTVENKKIGVITTQSFDWDAYTEHDVTMLKSLAIYVAIAIDNATAYQVIDAKKSLITSSINAAQTIQQAILPSQDLLASVFQEHFVIYKPKDIVSGDFYWMSKIGSKVVLIVADCTGHGVPGAFMSMIGNTLLNEIVNQKQLLNPAFILEMMHQGIWKALKQETSKNTDGMDMSVCVFEETAKGTVCIEFAGAKQKLNYIENGELKIVNGTRKGIGGRRKNKKFDNNQIEVSKGTIVYLFTDGYPDQPNPKRKRMGSPYLQAVLVENKDLSLDAQKEVLEETLIRYANGESAVDDITVLGVKV